MKAFIIMPFDPEFDDVYERLIKAPLEEVGYDVSRADSFLNQRNILQDIIIGITETDLIVADLTTMNANVFYELGLCHGLDIPTIMIAQSKDDIPFDLQPYKTQLYTTHFVDVDKLKQSLKDIAEKHKGGTVLFGNPVKDFRPHSYEETQPANPTQLSETSKDIVESNDTSLEKSIDSPNVQVIEEDEEKGIIDSLAESVAAGEEIGYVFSDLASQISSLNSRIESHTGKMAELNQNPNIGTAVQIQRVMMQVAANMNTFSLHAEEQTPKAAKAVDSLIESNSEIALWLDPSRVDHSDAFSNFKEAILSLLESTHVGLDGTRGFRGSVNSLTGISKEVNSASRRQVKVLSELITIMEKVESFCTRTLAILEEKIHGEPSAPEPIAL